MGNGQNNKNDEANSTEDTTQDNSPKVVNGRPCFRVALLHYQEPAHERTLRSSISDGNSNVVFVRCCKNTTGIIYGTVLLSKSCYGSWIQAHAKVRTNALVESLTTEQSGLILDKMGAGCMSAYL